MIPLATTRFAPSPTGPLHLGHARAAFFAHDLARRLGGRFLLRIEDIDGVRCRPEWTTAIATDLDWLGLVPDAPPLVQSTRMDIYRAAVAELAGRGLAYPCFCTRGAIRRELGASAGAPHASDGALSHDPDGAPLYPGTCRALAPAERAARLAAGDEHCWRLDMAAAHRAAGALTRLDGEGTATACQPARFGDVVLARRDTPASYHLAATLDDAASGVTIVTRAVDLEPAADLHRLLQALMNWPAPRYAHHPLVLDASGRRLSKRDGAASLASLRAAGMTPADVRRLVSCNAASARALPQASDGRDLR